MVTRADDMIDRRRLRRKLTFWRVLAILIAAIGIAAASNWLLGDEVGIGSNHIAKVSITGMITEDEDLLQRLERIRKSPAVKGVILSIDSPGGTTVGGESIFDAVRQVAAEKPVVAEVGTLAASAGYMIATASDHIVARKTSIVGSIGVLVQYPDVSGLMDKLGIKLEEIKSSPLKAEPSPFKPTSDAARAMIRSMILDSYDWFIGLVESRRPLTREEVVTLADGSIFTGRQALEKKLIDEVGGEKEAIAWLGTKGVDEKLRVIEWKPRSRGVSSYFDSSAGSIIGKALGLPDYSDDIIRKLGAERLFLDGLVSLWHP
ncbi:signal peptide peptidase SppA [Pseudaminobacter soli (ex Li et al. 2025)]|uniref:Signal peptide peptidase SppA n=1 Tax=Pseudaminobacter soli (ex Li et al. 2025) TaxID=1295366 RepID=A0A2P7RZJ4_9HYPH|nr:signal peptide peptidase SppA [Mesorhizobium soli]PSJ55613.1 signal peptide peptidase SppA [Mesorhizobium soli]